MLWCYMQIVMLRQNLTSKDGNTIHSKGLSVNLHKGVSTLDNFTLNKPNKQNTACKISLMKTCQQAEPNSPNIFWGSQETASRYWTPEHLAWYCTVWIGVQTFITAGTRQALGSKVNIRWLWLLCSAHHIIFVGLIFQVMFHCRHTLR